MTLALTRLESAAILAGLICLAAVSFGVGGALGAVLAWSEAADRLAEARAAQADAYRVTLDCKVLADGCVAAVGGLRRPK